MNRIHQRRGWRFSITPQIRSVIQWYERSLRINFSRSSTGIFTSDALFSDCVVASDMGSVAGIDSQRLVNVDRCLTEEFRIGHFRIRILHTGEVARARTGVDVIEQVVVALASFDLLLFELLPTKDQLD